MCALSPSLLANFTFCLSFPPSNLSLLQPEGLLLLRGKKHEFVVPHGQTMAWCSCSQYGQSSPALGPVNGQICSFKAQPSQAAEQVALPSLQ